MASDILSSERIGFRDDNSFGEEDSVRGNLRDMKQQLRPAGSVSMREAPRLGGKYKPRAVLKRAAGRGRKTY
jgi:hypothetical protein